MICEHCRQEFVVVSDDESVTVYACPTCGRTIEERKMYV